MTPAQIKKRTKAVRRKIAGLYKRMGTDPNRFKGSANQYEKLRVELCAQWQMLTLLTGETEDGCSPTKR